MRNLPAVTLVIAGLLQSCLDPAPAPPPTNGSRATGVKSGDEASPEAASPHVGDKNTQKNVPSPGKSANQSQVVAAVPPPTVPAPWVPNTQTAPQAGASTQSSPPNDFNSILASLAGQAAGALGGGSLGGYLGNLLGNQELGSLLGSVAGATLGGGLAQSSQGTVK